MTTDDLLRKVLRPGISGFGGAPDPRWTLAGFRAACHAAARAVGGTLVSSEAPGPGNNHYKALMQRAEPRWILLNAIRPFLAFARPGGDLRYTFVDDPPLAAAFHGPCEPLPAALLTAPLDLQAVVPLLGAVELAQARYWRPARVGDLVFNHWD
jgi:hypothetical protein